MKTLTIKLKQHTPLIHFQHDQEGATLRASEVKPKLDNFILTQLGKGDYEIGKKIAEKKEWLIGNAEHCALNYKMRIEGENKQESVTLGVTNVFKNETTIYKTDPFPFLLANMGGKKKEEELMNLSMYDYVDLVLSFNKMDLFDEVNQSIDLFFATHNFGQRQSKGFGCFYPVSGKEPESIFIMDYAKFELAVPVTGTLDCYKKLFDAIELFYKTIRSGINQNNIYLKSLMYFYAKEQNMYWDKRTIRHKFKHFNPNKEEDKGEKNDNKKIGDINPDKVRLYRDMLGLSSSQEWMFYHDTITKEHNPTNGKEKIDRFQSPLLIKPIHINNKFEVFLIPTNIPNEYKNAEFLITSQKRQETFSLRTPGEFDLIDFLDYITYKDVKKWMLDTLKKQKVNNNRRSKEIIDILCKIYNSLEYYEKE